QRSSPPFRVHQSLRRDPAVVEQRRKESVNRSAQPLRRARLERSTREHWRSATARDDVEGVPNMTSRKWRSRVLAAALGVAAAGVFAATAAAAPPANTAPPSISGTPTVGQTLTASDGTGSNTPTSFTYQWQRCDADVAICSNLVGATSKTYTVPLADLGYRLRVRVTARNPKGADTATSAITTVVAPAVTIVNHRPTVTILVVQFVGSTVYARFRICDHSLKNLAILETDS